MIRFLKKLCGLVDKQARLGLKFIILRWVDVRARGLLKRLWRIRIHLGLILEGPWAIKSIIRICEQICLWVSCTIDWTWKRLVMYRFNRNICSWLTRWHESYRSETTCRACVLWLCCTTICIAFSEWWRVWVAGCVWTADSRRRMMTGWDIVQRIIARWGAAIAIYEAWLIRIREIRVLVHCVASTVVIVNRMREIQAAVGMVPGTSRYKSPRRWRLWPVTRRLVTSRLPCQRKRSISPTCTSRRSCLSQRFIHLLLWRQE